MQNPTSQFLILDQQLIAERAYWVERLASGLIEDVSLRLDYRRPDLFTAETRSVPIEISGETYKKLINLTNGGAFLTYTTLMTSLKICLQRYTGNASIVVGSPERRQEGEKAASGNVLAIVDRLEPTLTFRQLLLQVRQTLLDAYKRQRYPFERLVRDLELEHIENRCPLFDIALALTNIHREMPPVKNDVTITFTQTPTQLSGDIVYNPSLFQRETIERFAQSFVNLLDDGLANTGKSIAALQILSATERHKILVEWNDTQTDYPETQCMHNLFEAQVEADPEAVAVVFQDEALTYRALNDRANQLANHLRDFGVAADAERVVGVCIERSLEMVIAVLGILKAGGAYLPLDPTYPQQRLAFMLSDSQVSVILTQAALTPTVEKLCDAPDGAAPKIICLDSDWEQIAERETGNLAGVTPDSLAYTIYTSGSTGMPKGVLIEHRGLTNLALAQIQGFHVQSDSRVLQFASLNFDASISEIAMTLCSGATLVMVAADELLPGSPLTNLINACEVTHVTLPPSALAVMDPEQLPTLQTVIAAGEACPAKQVERWSKGRCFINAYGPSETTVCATMTKCLSGNNKPPIGSPIANTQTYILDNNLQPVPVGVDGELYIGGVGLARGYLNRPELTAERFIPNPFSDNPNARLYKTGDVVRYLPESCGAGSGNMTFVGRADHQVKLHGFRIELGEIEAALLGHAAVRETVVIVREDQPDQKRLVAYLVGESRSSKSSLNAQELRKHLQASLPDYMIPSAFVFLDALPLTPSRKIDRDALPSPDKVGSIEGYIAPRDAVETQLANLWADILNISFVGIRDNFFDLGGHSLLAAQLVARIEKQFETKFPLTAFFQHATIEQLAIILRKNNAVPPWSPLVPIQPDGTRRPFFCVPGGIGVVTYMANLARHLGNNQPFYGLQAKGLDGISPPHTTMEAMAAEYLQAIKTVQPEGPYLLGGHSSGGRIAFATAQALQEQGDEVALLVIFDTNAPSLEDATQYVVGDDAEWITFFAESLQPLIGKLLDVSTEALRTLRSDEQLDYLYEKLEQANWLPVVNSRELGGVVQVFKTAFEMHYAPKTTYPTRIILLRSSPDVSSDIDTMAPIRTRMQTLIHRHSGVDERNDASQQRTWGWQAYADGEVEVYDVPGNHISMMAEPHVQVLAAQLNQCLQKFID